MMTATELQLKAAALALTEFGQNGVVLVNDTTVITGNYRIMLVLTDATFTTFTSNYTKNGEVTAMAGADLGTLTAGTKLSGKITAVTLATGSVFLVK